MSDGKYSLIAREMGQSTEERVRAVTTENALWAEIHRATFPTCYDETAEITPEAWEAARKLSPRIVADPPEQMQ